MKAGSSSLLASTSLLCRRAIGSAAASAEAQTNGTFWQRLAAAAVSAVEPTAALQPTNRIGRHDYHSAAIAWGAPAELDCHHGRLCSLADANWTPAVSPAVSAREFSTKAPRKARKQQQVSNQQQKKSTPAAAADDHAGASAKGAQAADGEAQGPSAERLAAMQADIQQWLADKPINEMGAEDVNRFFFVTPERIPEAFQQYYTEASGRGETTHERGGCKALEEEFDTTATELLLYREVMHDLRQTVEGSGTLSSGKPVRQKRQVYLDGATGSGKSIALAALADWGRAAGRVVVYVSSGHLLMNGGFFYKNEAGSWDTPDIARLLMRTVLAQHEKQLAALPSGNGDGSLADLIRAGIESKDAHESVDAAVDMLDQLRTQEQVPVLFLVDQYNALHWPTGYYEWQGDLKRRNILPTELRLVMAIRSLMEGEAPVNGAVVTATTHSRGISRRLSIPRPKGSLMQVPRFNLKEAQAWMAHMARCGVVPDGTSQPRVQREQLAAFHLTGGNPKELRHYASGLLY